MSASMGFRYSMREQKRKLAAMGRGTIARTNKRNFMVIALGAAEFLISYDSIVAMKKAGDRTVYANENYTYDKKDKKGRSQGWRWCSVTTRTHAYDFGAHAATVIDGERFETMIKTVFPELLSEFNVSGAY